MDTKKFEQLIEYIVNEDENKARELFHEIVVEKSREIYESMMDEEMMDDDMEEGMGGQVGGLLDEINAEQMHEADDEGDDLDDVVDDDEEVIDLDSEDDDTESQEHDDIEDAVIRIEDKLDQLMDEFEELMGREEGEEEGAADMMAGDEEEEEGAADMMAGDEEEEEGEEEMMEAITLKKVPVTHGDNGSNPRSVSLHEPKIKTQGVNPVKFSGSHEAVPTSPKGASNFYSKGETEVKHAKQWKNAPAQAGQDLEKAPKAHTAQASGVNTKSVMGESKRTSRRRV